MPSLPTVTRLEWSHPLSRYCRDRTPRRQDVRTQSGQPPWCKLHGEHHRWEGAPAPCIPAVYTTLSPSEGAQPCLGWLSNRSRGIRSPRSRTRCLQQPRVTHRGPQPSLVPHVPAVYTCSKMSFVTWFTTNSPDTSMLHSESFLDPSRFLVSEKARAHGFEDTGMKNDSGASDDDDGND